jgi:hypothetical protein
MLCPICHYKMYCFEGDFYICENFNSKCFLTYDDVIKTWRYNYVYYSQEEFEKLLKWKAFW